MLTTKTAGITSVKLLDAGWSPRTNRFYSRDVFDVVISQFKPPSLGDFMFDVDADFRLSLANASHRTEKLYTKNDGTELWADITVLDTPCGRLLIDLHKTKSLRFDCLMVGKINRFDEVIVDSVQFNRVVAFGVY